MPWIDCISNLGANLPEPDRRNYMPKDTAQTWKEIGIWQISARQIS